MNQSCFKMCMLFKERVAGSVLYLSSDSQESDRGNFHRASNHSELLYEMPRYCRAVETFLFDFLTL